MKLDNFTTKNLILGLRRAMGLSQSALAARVGVSKRTILLWEAGTVPRRGALWDLALLARDAGHLELAGKLSEAMASRDAAKARRAEPDQRATPQTEDERLLVELLLTTYRTPALRPQMVMVYGALMPAIDVLATQQRARIAAMERALAEATNSGGETE